MTTKTSETPELQLQDGETAIDVSMADMATMVARLRFDVMADFFDEMEKALMWQYNTEMAAWDEKEAQEYLLVIAPLMQTADAARKMHKKFGKNHD